MQIPLIYIPVIMTVALILFSFIISNRTHQRNKRYNWFINNYAPTIKDNFKIDGYLIENHKKIPINEHAYVVVNTNLYSDYTQLSQNIDFYFKNKRVASAMVHSAYTNRYSLTKQTTVSRFDKPYRKEVELFIKKLYEKHKTDDMESQLTIRDKQRLEKLRLGKEYMKIKKE